MAVLTRGTADEKLELAFDAFDMDGDGCLEREELHASIEGLQNILNPEQRQKLPSVDKYVDLIFEKFDTNRDGVISLEEYKRGATAYPDLLRALGRRDNLDAMNADPEPQPGLDVSTPLHNHRVITWTSTTDWNRVLLIMAGISEACSRAAVSLNKQGAPEFDHHSDDDHSHTSDDEDVQDDVEDSHTEERQRGAIAAKASLMSVGLHNDAGHEQVTFNIATDNNEARGVFTDYAPQLFVRLRTRFGISHVGYMDSLGIEQILGNVLLGSLSSFHTFESSSKSGAAFFFSHDRKYLIKTCSVQEKRFLLSILPQYASHCMDNKNTLLPRFCGLHKIRMRTNAGSQTMRFVVMTNVFATTLRVHEVYDLKGSTVGRESGVGSSIMKDLDIKETGRRLRVGKTLSKDLVRQIRHDTAFLQLHNIVDYSMLVGIHDRAKARADAEVEGVDLEEYKVRQKEKYEAQQRRDQRALRHKEAKRRRAKRRQGELEASVSVEPVPGVSGVSKSCAKHPHALAAYHVPALQTLDPSCFACAADAAALERRRLIRASSASEAAKARARERIKVVNLADVSESCPSHADMLAAFKVSGDLTDMKMCYNCAVASSMLLERRQKRGRLTNVKSVSDLEKNDKSASPNIRATFDVLPSPKITADPSDGGAATNSSSRVSLGPTDLWHESDTGGISQRRADSDEPQGDEVYFLGVIDMLINYGKRKTAETKLKSLIYDSDGISVIPPDRYADRFRKAMEVLIE